MAVSKIVAGRPKDMVFAMSVLHVFSVRAEQIEALLEEYVGENPGEKEKVSVNMDIFRHKLCNQENECPDAAKQALHSGK